MLLGKDRKEFPITENGEDVPVSIHEVEQSHGLPLNYTSACNKNGQTFTKTQRLSLLGNGLCAQTIAEKLQSLTFYFATTTKNE